MVAGILLAAINLTSSNVEVVIPKTANRDAFRVNCRRRRREETEERTGARKRRFFRFFFA